MKKLHFLILLIHVFFTTANAQSPVLEWTHTIGGPSNDYTKAVAVDKQGNVYSTGSFKGIVDFDPFLLGTSIISLAIKKTTP